MGALTRARTALEVRAAAVSGLAGLLEAGHGPGAALVRWEAHVPPVARPGARRVGAAVRLGVPAAAALRAAPDLLGEDLPVVAAALDLQRRYGAAGARLLAELARSLRARAEGLEQARAASAGARLSARMLAGLPLAALAFAPAAGAPLGDASGATLAACGGALALAGALWIERLVPRPPDSEVPEAAFAAALGAALRAGLHLGGALRAAATVLSAPRRERLERLLDLGVGPSQALRACGLGDVAAELEGAARLGIPLADRLEGLASALRVAALRAFEQDLRRAPVRMVLPLGLCGLPAFVLLGLGPFLRALAS